MEESIKRAEKLLHVTNSALAQMKYNLIFDDLNGNTGAVNKFQERRVKGTSENKRTKRNSTFDDDLMEFEKDFMSEANEMLMKMDKFLEPNHFSSARKASKARDKMKEINAKLESRRLEQLKANQTERSRPKLLNLFPQTDPTPRKTARSSKESGTNKQTPVRDSSIRRGKELSPRKSESLIAGLTSRQKSKEDLKKKLIETQEIVDRGFQTARQLTQKVENITKTTDRRSERTPASEKTYLTEATNSRSSERIGTSSEIGKTPTTKKCVKCHRVKEIKKKKEEEEIEKESKKVREDRNKVVNIKRQEKRRPMIGSKLKVQRLPSLHIKGGLQVQKIHNLEILPQTEEASSSRVNTAFKIISHDQMEREKTEMSLQKLKRENCFCGDEEIQENCIECFNCGKLIRIQEQTVVDPREIDRLLLECNFNVFDPRIDEFVERCKQPGTLFKFLEERKEERGDVDVTRENVDLMKVRKTEEKERKENMKKKKVLESMRRRFKIKELSEELSRRYRKKADEIEDDHIEFENILRDLFKKVDESREFFDNCKFLTSVEKQKERRSPTRLSRLSMTQPVTVSFTEENQPEEHEEKESNDRPAVLSKEKKIKLDKKDVKNKHKSRTLVQREPHTDDEEDSRDKAKLPKKFFRRKEANKKVEEEKNLPKLPNVATEIFKEIQSSRLTKDKVPNEEIKEIWPPGISLLKSSSSEESNAKEKEEIMKTSISEEKTENDYDSDFEAESGPTFNNEIVQNSEEDEDYVEDREEEDQAIIRCMKKLSTISEVDSELEKKLSEVEQKSETSEKHETVSKSEDVTESMEIPKDSKLLDDVKDVSVDKVLQKKADSASSSESKVSKTPKTKQEEEEEVRNISSSRSSKSLKERQSKGSKEGSVARESSSTEMVASLKEVLSALKDQFAKTQSLADKLTENVKELKTEREGEKPEIVQKNVEEEEEEKKKKKEEFILNPCLMSGDSAFLNNCLVSNLQKMRKDPNVDAENLKSPLSLLSRTQNLGFKVCERVAVMRKSSLERREASESSRSEGILSDDGVSSLGELNLNNLNEATIASDRKRKGSEKSESSSVSECSFVKSSSRKKSSRLSSGRSGHRSRRDSVPLLALGRNKDEMSYSEGEVRSNGLLDDDHSSIQSIGEVISEHISAESSLE